jgi:hypothetical protein
MGFVRQAPYFIIGKAARSSCQVLGLARYGTKSNEQQGIPCTLLSGGEHSYLSSLDFPTELHTTVRGRPRTDSSATSYISVEPSRLKVAVASLA